VAAVWAEILNVSDVRAGDNFFELGGTSLQAMQAAALLEQCLGRSVHARKFVMESLRSLARSYDDLAVAASATSAAGVLPAPRAQGQVPRAVEPPDAPGRNPQAGSNRTGLVERLTGAFRRQRAAPAAAAGPAAEPARTQAPPAPPAIAVPQPIAAAVPAAAVERAAPALPRLARLKHAQPPVSGAFRATTGDGVERWYRRDETSGSYERVEH
jgi:hypothetical protein